MPDPSESRAHTTVQYSVSRGVTVVKIGGAALTNKSTFETINTVVFTEVVSQIVQVWGQQRGKLIVVHGAGSFGHFQAKKYGVQTGTSRWDEKKQRNENSIQSNTDTTTSDLAELSMGFCLTRQSVTRLCTLFVDALIVAGIPAVSVPVLPMVFTCDREPVSSRDSMQCVNMLLARGMLPIMHGDAVLDTAQFCSILSGDTILRELSVNKSYNVSSVVFMTNVLGIYDRPPHRLDKTNTPPVIQVSDMHSMSIHEGSSSDTTSGETIFDRNSMTFTHGDQSDHIGGSPRLLRHVTVSKLGSKVTIWNGHHLQRKCSTPRIALTDTDQNLTNIVLGASRDTDVTGGMNTKIAEARAIADAGVPVIIVEAGTQHSLQALRDGVAIVRRIEETGGDVGEWRGTVVSSTDMNVDCITDGN